VARPKKQSSPLVDVPSSADKIARVVGAFFGELRIGSLMWLDEWADAHYILPQETASEYGRWRTSRFPFLRRIMRCLSPPSCAEEPVWVKGNQLGGTSVAIAWGLFSADVDPGPFTYVLKRPEDCDDFSDQKLAASLRACDRLKYILGSEKPKGYVDRKELKSYPGGYFNIGPANSSDFLRSKSTGKGVADEEDTYEPSVGNQGSSVALLKKRMTNFPGHKLFRLSTPVNAETSTIWPAFEAGSQEHVYVPCPHCNPRGAKDGPMLLLEWDVIRWSDETDPLTGLPLEVWAECPHCAEKIDEHKHKTWMLDHGVWMTVKGSTDGKPYEVGDVRFPSFRTPAFYSPPGFFSWADAVRDWFLYLEKRDINLLRVFVNQVCAKPFKITGDEVAYRPLMARKENYNAEVPDGGLVITAGVDVQKDRIECEVVAWGLSEESWSLEYTAIQGDPFSSVDASGDLSPGVPGVWKLLDAYLKKQFAHAGGKKMPIEVVMIDSKYATECVHQFCAYREARRIFPIQGKDGWGKGFWSVAKRRHEKYRTVVYTAYTDEIKTAMYSRLNIRTTGPGYCHFPNRPEYDDRYFKGLTCEQMITQLVFGYPKLRWVCPEGARNEPIDLRNYAYVAFKAYPLNLIERQKYLNNQ
jgi:phage terminase large subunit GpA-like protein